MYGILARAEEKRDRVSPGGCRGAGSRVSHSSDGVTKESDMAFDVSSGSGVRSQVNITPLIDVVLVLLIIFMVMTPTTMKHLKPQVARESSEPVTAGPQPVVVEMNASRVKVGDDVVPWAELHGRIKERLLHSGQRAVFLKIDDDVEYGEAVRLFDLCKGAGAEILAVPPGSRG